MSATPTVNKPSYFTFSLNDKYNYKLTLCKPNKEQIAEIIYTEIKYSPSLFEISKLDFTIPYYLDSNLEEYYLWDLVKENYLVLLNIDDTDVGYFTIKNIEINDDGKTYKKINTLSREVELTYKNIRGFHGLKRLYNSTNSNKIEVTDLAFNSGNITFTLSEIKYVTVSILETDSLNQIATKIKNAIDAESGYTATVSQNEITVTTSLSGLLDIEFSDDDDTLVGINIYGQGVLNYVLDLVQGWSVGSINSTILSENKYREFDVSEQKIYNFLTEEVANAFKCVFLFDCLNNEIIVERIDDIGENRGLYISEENLIKSVNYKVSMDKVITRLYAYGSGDISINSKNITGQSYLEDFSYFKTTEWMSQDLIDALNDYNNLVNSYSATFQGYLSSLDSYKASLLTKEYELAVLQGELDILQNEKNLLMQSGSNGKVKEAANSGGFGEVLLDSSASNTPDYYLGKTITIISGKGAGQSKTVINRYSVPLQKRLVLDSQWSVIPDTTSEYSFISNLNSQITAKQVQVNNKQSEIDVINNNITSTNIAILNLKITLKKENNFTSSQLQELDSFIFEDTYQNNDFNQDHVSDLLNDAEEYLEKFRTPPIEFKLKLIDFLSILEYKFDWHKLKLGDIINVSFSKLNIDTQVRLISYSHDSLNNDLEIEFSTYNTVYKAEEEIKNILKEAVKQARTLSIERNTFKQYVNQDKNRVDYFLDSPLKADRNIFYAGYTNNIIFDKFGLRLTSQTIGVSGEMRILDNAIMFSNDNFNTASVAIDANGINGKYIRGEIIAGNNLLIINEGGTVEIDANGMRLTDLDLTLTKGINTIYLNPTDGIKIQKSGVDQFYIDSSGNLNLSGNINLSGGSITWGSVNAPDYSHIGGTKPPTDADNTSHQLRYDSGIRGFYYNSSTNTLDIFADYITAGTISANRINTTNLYAERIYKSNAVSSYGEITNLGDIALYYLNKKYFEIFNGIDHLIFKHTFWNNNVSTTYEFIRSGGNLIYPYQTWICSGAIFTDLIWSKEGGLNRYYARSSGGQNLSFQINGGYLEIRNGSTYQGKILISP
jgi:hypothetical protein